MKRLTVSIFIFLILCNLCACRDKNELRFDSKFDSLKRTADYNLVLTAVNDTVKQWIKMDLFYFHQFGLKKLPSEWKIDDWIFFNSASDKCLITMMMRDFDQQYPYSG